MATSLNNSKPARDGVGQQVVAVRYEVNFTDSNLTTGNRQVAAIPAGAIVIATDINVVTAFTGGTAALSAGTNNPTSNNLTGAAAVTVGLVTNVPPVAGGTAIGPLAVDTPVYVKANTGLTAGKAQIIHRYVVNEPTLP